MGGSVKISKRPVRGSPSLTSQVSLPLSWDSEMVSSHLDRGTSIVVFCVARFWPFKQWVLALLGYLRGRTVR